MQTSVLTPLTLYASLPEDAETMLAIMPEESTPCTKLSEIPFNRRTILITHDQSSARQATHWVEKQPDFRHGQILLILPEGSSRLTPSCRYLHRPLKLKEIMQFLHSSQTLPELPETLQFTEIETRLIEQLYLNEEGIGHQSLMQNIWGYSAELETHTLETHLYRLRKKLEKSGFQILTENGSYRLLSSSK